MVSEALPAITGRVTIQKAKQDQGTSVVQIARSANAGTGQFRVFTVAAGGHLTLDRVRVSHGDVDGDGGGIHNAGTLILQNGSVVTGNTASGSGGGIYNSGTLQMSGGCLVGNRAASSTAVHSTVPVTISGVWWGRASGPGDGAVNDRVTATNVQTTAPAGCGTTPDPPAQPDDCGYAPFPSQRQTPNAHTAADENQFATLVKFRSAPTTQAKQVGKFWGVKVNAANQPVNAQGGVIHIDFEGYRNVSALGVVHRNNQAVGAQERGNVTYRTDNRRFIPLYQHSPGDGYVWYLVEYNGSLGWIRRDLVNVDRCRTLPTLPAGDARLNLDTYYATQLPVSRGAAAIAPDPATWAPFGECVPGTTLSRALERCAYELYKQVYEDARFRSNGRANLKLQDVLGIVMLGEFGTDLPTRPYNQLNPPQKYFLEAAARNFAQVCAQRGHTPGPQAPPPAYTNPISCNLPGMTQVLLQVQSFYQEYHTDRSASDNVREVTEKRSNTGLITYKNYADTFANLIFNHPQWSQGLSSPPPVPFQWGNWLQGNPNRVYETAEGIVNGRITKPANVSTLQLGRVTWVHVVPNQITPLIKNSIYAAYNVDADPTQGDACQYTFAITISNHGLGETQGC